jgi:hypothetical protein
MASSATFVHGLELLGLVACGLTAIKLGLTGLYRRYRALLASLCLRFLGLTLVLFWFRDNLSSGAYQKFWIVYTPLTWIVNILVVLELYSLVLEKHKGLSTLGRWVQYAGLTISILISGLTLLPQIQSVDARPQSVIVGYYYAIERGIDLSLVVFLLFILLWLTRYPVPLSRNVLVHSVVYSMLFLSNTLSLLARVFFGLQLSRSVSTFMLGIFAACTLVWLIFLNPKGEEVRVSVPRFGPEQEQRILSQLEALNSTLLKVSRH